MKLPEQMSEHELRLEVSEARQIIGLLGTSRQRMMRKTVSASQARDVLRRAVSRVLTDGTARWLPEAQELQLRIATAEAERESDVFRLSRPTPEQALA